MNPTPPVTRTRATAGPSAPRGLGSPVGGNADRNRDRRDADPLVTQAGAHHVAGTPDVSRVDHHGRSAVVAAQQPLANLGEVRGAVAPPFGEKDQRVGA